MTYDIAPGRPGAEGSGRRGTHGAGGSWPSQAGQTPAPPVEAALRRYVLTRALAGSVLSALQWTGVTLLMLGALGWSAGWHLLAVLLLLVGFGVIVARALLAGVARRLAGAAGLGSATPEMQALVRQTRKGLRRELRRVGLPASPWAPLIIVARLARGRRRARTLALLSTVELTRAVPRDQLDAFYRQLTARHPTARSGALS